MMIEASGLDVELGQRQVLHGIQFAIERGSMVAIVGPNGAGKSTLLRAMAGVQSVMAGDIEIEGRPISAYGRRELARTLAYLPQDRMVAWPVTVETVVALGRQPHLSSLSRLSDADRLTIMDAMRSVEIEHLRDRVVTRLSGGERARVLMARALAQQTPLLLTDEPTAGLDPSHALSLFHRLRGLADQGRTIAIALHDLGLAVRFCDAALLLQDGRTVAFGKPSDVLTRDNLATVYGVDAQISTIDGVPLFVAKATLT